jgi:hypothetical protein
MKNLILRNQLRKTPQGRIILKSLKLSGAENEILGKGFFKKIGKGLKAVGKVTGKITGRVAKVAAGLVGIPPGAIDALAKVDPTAHKAIVKSLINSPAGTKAADIVTGPGGTQLPGFLSNVKPVYLAAGAAGIVGIILLVKGKK